MNKPTIIETPSGDRLAILPLADYERLAGAAEETGDVRAYDEAKRRLATGEDELLPAEFANRILDGESPIRVWREYRGLNGKDLAAKAEISAAFLSQIENGERDGSFGTMKKIAEALSVSLDDLA
ncbi:helix-turn-helix domain-containing protein [Microvirga arsenatis]|uniref:Helix-turn-helix domain-containing protein n=1 Tax=Microvirga arsenatis TaxID=2692265 RepID=A0ABW9Z2W1_9HYPH|nr:helix-turn-helix transcriptional regulator [Microvirga arsenatis]NBJ13011.1 helix-turn-helix domain-containing protein [Microvirga arsenatis]NBJ26765.1 helix-turn-helix domain-containing protein [Microvirga arsenatis]